MSECRLVVDLGPEGPARSISIKLERRADAFLVAQRYDRPAELWDRGRKVCGLKLSRPGGVWVIS